jgi:hypothetical protein
MVSSRSDKPWIRSAGRFHLHQGNASMRPWTSQFRSGWGAVLSATLAVAVAVGLHAALLFRQEVAQVLEPAPLQVRQFGVGDGGRVALATFVSRSPVDTRGLCYGFVRHDLETRSHRRCEMPSGVPVWRFAVAARASVAFVSTIDGELYSLNLAAR